MIHKIRMCIRLSSLPLITYVCVCERETDRQRDMTGRKEKGGGRREDRYFCWSGGLLFTEGSLDFLR